MPDPITIHTDVDDVARLRTGRSYRLVVAPLFYRLRVEESALSYVESALFQLSRKQASRTRRFTCGCHETTMLFMRTALPETGCTVSND